MFFQGVNVKILDGFYKGEIGTIDSFDGFLYVIKLISKAKKVKIEENNLEIISDDEVK